MKHALPVFFPRLAALLSLALLGACQSNSNVASPTVQPASPDALATAGSRAAAGSDPAPGTMNETYSGLKYEVLKRGTGDRPTQYNRVKVHYHGTLADGSVFDSSVRRGEPTTFGLNQVIPGWQEGLLLMREGAKYRFVIPPQLAYGARGAPPKIGPNETLTFEVTLLDIL